MLNTASDVEFVRSKLKHFMLSTDDKGNLKD